MKEDYASEENDASRAKPASPLPASRGKGSAATLPTPPGEPHTVILLLTLCNPIEPTLTLRGPRGLLSYPIRCSFGYLAHGRQLL